MIDDGALCVDNPELEADAWHPDNMRTQASIIGAAVAVCRRCPLHVSCLAHAREHNELGIWGGVLRRFQGEWIPR